MEVSRKDHFQVRFKTHYAHLCRVAYGYVPNREECEDIVQDTFIAVWSKGKDELPEAEFLPYMLTSVKNNCISFLRRRRLETVPLDELPVSEDTSSVDECEDHFSTPTEETLDAALSTLPPKCREVFLMSKLRGMKYREIAAELNLSEKTVDNQMGKAIKLLRAYAAAHPLFLIILISLSILVNS